MKLFDRAVVGLLPLIPKPVVRKIADRYIAGETLDEAARTVRRLNEVGCEATVDVLGEFITDFREAEETAAAYHDVLDRIRQDKLRSNVSIKLTAFGLSLDGAKCYALVKKLVGHARELGNFVRIDMEDSPVTTQTLDLYRQLRRDGFENVGVVIQAYLRRSPNDVRELLSGELTRGTSFRLCKGIYVEPPEIAFKDREEIRNAYKSVLRQMFREGSRRVGIATHDPPLIEDARSLLREQQIPKERYEFQMLLGVAPAWRKRLVEEGHTVRIYVPFGKSWYGYSVRRLKENPSIAGYVAKAMIGLG
ncbi:MAG: proline dehydrogenase family protein [Planctomycetes bacterium]|nr:proline dehydrogenase family protein [Planctomycetota bacterium]